MKKENKAEKRKIKKENTPEGRESKNKPEG